MDLYKDAFSSVPVRALDGHVEADDLREPEACAKRSELVRWWGRGWLLPCPIFDLVRGDSLPGTAGARCRGAIKH